MIDGDQRHAEDQGEHLGRADADEQGADQARRVVDRDAADVGDDAGTAQGLVDDGQQPLQMGSAATSGTTPPKRACRSVCEAMTLERTAGRR